MSSDGPLDGVLLGIARETSLDFSITQEEDALM